MKVYLLIVSFLCALWSPAFAGQVGDGATVILTLDGIERPLDFNLSMGGGKVSATGRNRTYHVADVDFTVNMQSMAVNPSVVWDLFIYNTSDHAVTFTVDYTLPLGYAPFNQAALSYGIHAEDAVRVPFGVMVQSVRVLTDIDGVPLVWFRGQSQDCVSGVPGTCSTWHVVPPSTVPLRWGPARFAVRMGGILSGPGDYADLSGTASLGFQARRK